MAPGDLLGSELSAAVSAFHEAVASRLGISATEWKCLGVLARIGPATAGSIAALTGLTTGAVTGIIDRLERAGYVRREPNPRDRRSVIVCPLRQEEVSQAVAPIFASLGAAMAEVSSHYSAMELEAVSRFLSETAEVLRSETSRLKQR